MEEGCDEGAAARFFLRQGGVGVAPKKNRANRGWQLVSFFKAGRGGRCAKKNKASRGWQLVLCIFLTKVGKGGGLGSGVGVVPANLEQPRGWQLVSSF